MNSKVLACLDHSAHATSICSYGAWAALRMASPLAFVHVLDRHPEVAPIRDLSGSIGLGAQEALLQDLAALDEKRSRIAQEGGRLLLDGARQIAANEGIAEPEMLLRHGELVETLSEMEADTRLFVLGKRGEAADSAPGHTGRNLERVVRALHRPILVVPAAYQVPRNIMIAFDGSSTTRKGVEMIAASPLFRGLPCHVVMASTDTAAAQGQLDWARTQLETAGFAVHTAVVPREPETALPEYMRAQQIDLLVMGAYGHSRIRQFLVGSTTTTMIRTSTVPVLLLR